MRSPMPCSGSHEITNAVFRHTAQMHQCQVQTHGLQAKVQDVHLGRGVFLAGPLTVPSDRDDELGSWVRRISWCKASGPLGGKWGFIDLQFVVAPYDRKGFRSAIPIISDIYLQIPQTPHCAGTSAMAGPMRDLNHPDRALVLMWRWLLHVRRCISALNRIPIAKCKWHGRPV